MILKAVDLSAKHAQKVIFSAISLELEKGQKLAIIAPNGSGKSTLLELLAGLKERDSGTLNLFDEQMLTLKDFKKIRQKIGFLFQNSDEQFVCSTVLDDVSFSLLAHGLCQSEKLAHEKALEMLEMLNISHLKDEICLNLSGGQKRLVALAGVLVCEFELIFLDEPSAPLDKNATDLVANILKNSTSSMIITSHDKEFISKITQNIYTL